MVTGQVFNIMRYALNDGPGIRTTAFLQGCPLSCPWCHNPESQAAEPGIIFNQSRCIACGACRRVCDHNCQPDKCSVCGLCVDACCSGAREFVARRLTVNEMMNTLERDMVFYQQTGGGVTLSGGEPFCQPAFVLALLKQCKQRGIHTAVDTCGYCNREDLGKAAALADLFLYDLKLMDSANHARLTGKDNSIILENLVMLTELHNNVVVRVPLVPGFTDSDDNLKAMSSFLAGVAVAAVEMLPYHATGSGKYANLHRDYALANVPPPEGKSLEHAAGLLAASGHRITIGGRP